MEKNIFSIPLFFSQSIIKINSRGRHFCFHCFSFSILFIFIWQTISENDSRVAIQRRIKREKLFILWNSKTERLNKGSNKFKWYYSGRGKLNSLLQVEIIKAFSGNQVSEFPSVDGHTIREGKIYLNDDIVSISFSIRNKTTLSFSCVTLVLSILYALQLFPILKELLSDTLRNSFLFGNA